MERMEICPQCGSYIESEQPEAKGTFQKIHYSCGNIVDCTSGSHGNIYTDHQICNNKIEWENILKPYGGEFDDSAKLIDERFFGWIELCFYKDSHKKNWSNKNQGMSCTDKKFLDQYFNDKESYLSRVREIETMKVFSKPIRSIITKSYDDWIGEVNMEQIYEKLHERNGVEYNRLIYRVISADTSKYEGGYVVEENPVGGGDRTRDFYHREILDIIIENER